MLLLINRHLLLAFLIVFLVAFNAPDFNVGAANKEVSFVGRSSNGRLVGVLNIVSGEPVINLQFQPTFDTMPIFGRVVSNIGVTRATNGNSIVFDDLGYKAFIDAEQFRNGLTTQHLRLIEMNNHSGIRALPSLASARFHWIAAWNVELPQPVRDGGHINTETFRDGFIAQPLNPIELLQCLSIRHATGWRFADVRFAFTNTEGGDSSCLNHFDLGFRFGFCFSLKPKGINKTLDDGFANAVSFTNSSKRKILFDVQPTKGISINNILELVSRIQRNTGISLTTQTLIPGNTTFHSRTLLALKGNTLAGIGAINIVLSGQRIATHRTKFFSHTTAFERLLVEVLYLERLVFGKYAIIFQAQGAMS